MTILDRAVRYAAAHADAKVPDIRLGAENTIVDCYLRI